LKTIYADLPVKQAMKVAPVIKLQVAQQWASRFRHPFSRGRTRASSHCGWAWDNRGRKKKRMRNISMLIMLMAGMLTAGQLANAQQPAPVPRIGVLRSGSPSSHAAQHEAFRQGLRELGYIEGQNVRIEYRYAEGKRERFPALAAELVGLQVDCIVVGGTGLTAAAKQATSTIPIVVGSAGDLVGTGLVASLARPGGNITGSTDISPDLGAKRLELLKDVVPRALRVALLWYPTQVDEEEVKQTESAARTLAVQVQSVQVRDPNEFQSAYAAMRTQQADALMIIQGSFTLFHRRQLVELAAQYRLPTMCEQLEWTQDGCLVSYGPDLTHLWRRAAAFVDKILKGAKPADLPVEQPMKFELVINLKTAQTLGLTLPPHLLFLADEVIQ